MPILSEIADFKDNKRMLLGMVVVSVVMAVVLAAMVMERMMMMMMMMMLIIMTLAVVVAVVVVTMLRNNLFGMMEASYGTSQCKFFFTSERRECVYVSKTINKQKTPGRAFSH